MAYVRLCQEDSPDTVHCTSQILTDADLQSRQVLCAVEVKTQSDIFEVQWRSALDGELINSESATVPSKRRLCLFKGKFTEEELLLYCRTTCSKTIKADMWPIEIDLAPTNDHPPVAAFNAMVDGIYVTNCLLYTSPSPRDS